MTVADIIRENDADIIVKVEARNPAYLPNTLTEEYYHGEVGKIPAELHEEHVIKIWWAFGAQCHVIEIACRQNNAKALKC